MKNLFKKIFISTLSFVMMFACAFTFTTNKASADDTFSLSSATINSYVQEAYADLVIEPADFIGDSSCYIIDGRFFTREIGSTVTLTTSTCLADLAGTTFLQEMARRFAQERQIDATLSNGMIDVEVAFARMTISILVHISGTSYVDIMTGQDYALSTYFDLQDERLNVGENSYIQGDIIFPKATSLYSLLLNIQNNHEGTLSVYAKRVSGSTSGGLRFTLTN